MTKYLKSIIRLVVSCALIAFLFQKIPWQQVLENLSNIKLSYFFISIGVMLFAWLINSKKWQILLEHLGIRQKLFALFRLNLASIFYASVLPGGQLTGETVKCIKITKDSQQKGKLIFSVLIDRITGFIAIILLGFLGLLISKTEIALYDKLIFLYSFLLFGSLLVLLIFKAGIVDWLYHKINNYKGGTRFKIGLIISKIKNLLFLYSGAYKILFWSLIYGVLFQLLGVVHVYLLAIALNIEIGLINLLWIMPLVSIVLLLPITILGLGLREGSFVYFLALAGISSISSLSLSLLVSTAYLSMGLFGGFLELIELFKNKKFQTKSLVAGEANKILMIVPTSFFAHRGCHIRILEEAKALIKKGYRVKILSYHVGDNIEGIDIERIFSIPWYKKLESGPSWHKVYLDFFLLIKSFKTVLVYRPNIIHCHLHEGALIGVILKIFFQKKIIFDSQGSLADELKSFKFISPKTFKYGFFCWIEKLINKHADKIIVSNKSNYKILAGRYGVSAGRLSIIPDGIDLAEIAGLSVNRRELKSRLGIPPGKKTIVYLGTLNAVEGIDDLIGVLKELAEYRHDFFVLAMGYPNEDKYLKIARDRGLENFIKFIGRMDYAKIYKYLSIGDFAISLKLPTTEGNGKLLNYVALDLPVICFDHYSNRYILGDYGLYLGYGKSYNENARAMNAFLDASPDEIKRLTAGAKARLLDNFVWERIVDDLIKIYKNNN